VFGDFEWDDVKAATNLKKHGVSFEEAIVERLRVALADPQAIEAPDLVHPERSITVGRSALLRLLFVVHTQSLSNDRIRIISARRASAAQ
jgi:uncharacterized DUF497 family protein